MDLANLQEVAPLDGAVEITEDFAEIWRANGLTATVTQPDVTLTFEPGGGNADHLRRSPATIQAAEAV